MSAIDKLTDDDLERAAEAIKIVLIHQGRGVYLVDEDVLVLQKIVDAVEHSSCEKDMDNFGFGEAPEEPDDLVSPEITQDLP